MARPGSPQRAPHGRGQRARTRSRRLLASVWGGGRVRWVSILLVGLMVASAVPLAPAAAQGSHNLSENAQTQAVAVARTEGGGTIGTAATISVSVSDDGSGGVFLDTQPLTGTDMQGSARIAARVAASTTGYALEEHDFYFVVRSDSPVISGPSAGSVMALAATVALENLHREPGEERWEISKDVMVTGTISPDGSIGPVGGILEKARAAAGEGAGLFLVPEGQGQVRPRTDAGPDLSEGEAVNVSAFCRAEVGIQCREVGGLEELVRLATGHRFVQPELGEPPSTARYEETLRPLADRLIDRGRLYQKVWAKLNTSSIPEGAARDIHTIIQNAQDDVQRAQTNVDEGRFYSAASRAFTGAIQARHASLLLAYHQSGQNASVVQEAIGNASRAVEQARQAAGDANVTGMQTFYTVGAAQKRVSSAETRLEEAREAWNGSRGPNPTQALQAAARSVERSATVHWWLRLGDQIGPGPELRVPVDQVADEMLDFAEEMLTYTTQVLGGRQPSQAAQSMENAREDARRGFHAGAAIEAAEVQVVSALSLEAGAGAVTEDKLDASRQAAERAIQAARARTVEPILPIALFEFGTVQENPAASLRFYRSARVLAGMTATLEADPTPTPTEFVGPWSAEEHESSVGQTYTSLAVGWFTVGVFGTAAVGLFALALASSPRRPP